MPVGKLVKAVIQAAATVSRTSSTSAPKVARFGTTAVKFDGWCMPNHEAACKSLKEGRVEQHYFWDWQAVINAFARHGDKVSVAKAHTLAIKDGERAVIPPINSEKKEQCNAFKESDLTKEELIALAKSQDLATIAENSLAYGFAMPPFENLRDLKHYFFLTDQHRLANEVENVIYRIIKATGIVESGHPDFRQHGDWYAHLDPKPEAPDQNGAGGVNYSAQDAAHVNGLFTTSLVEENPNAINPYDLLPPYPAPFGKTWTAASPDQNGAIWELKDAPRLSEPNEPPVFANLPMPSERELAKTKWILSYMKENDAPFGEALKAWRVSQYDDVAVS